MHYDLLIVQACEFNETGDGVHRFHAPSRALSQLPGICVIDTDLHHRYFPQLAELADVLILAGFDADIFPLLSQRRAAGRITVFEANDYYDDIQSWNPISTRWYDRGLQASFRQGLTLTDGVQTSMPELARRWRERTSHPVVAFRNQLTDVPALPPLPSRPLTIGWGGSPGHFADWYHLAPRLQHWLDTHPAVHLAVMNSEFAREFLHLGPERYHFHQFGTLAQYLAFLNSLDIGLAPLLPSGYNRCRSDVKFLEYASRGVVGIYADLEPYRDTVVDNETGLLYRTDDELFAALDRLVAQPELREKIRRQAHAHVLQHRQLDQNIQERLDFYRTLMPTRSALGRGGTLPAPIVAAAKVDGCYLQLRPLQPEQALAATRGAENNKDSAQNLLLLAEQHPGYLAPLQSLGQQLNNLRDYRRALAYLQRAEKLHPQSARTQAEIARAHYLLGDEQRARHLLEQTLNLNPHFLTAWQYLLRLLQVMKAGDGAEWAARSRNHFPEHYPLALQGVALYQPADAVRLLRQLLEQHGPTLAVEELPAAVTAFSDTIREVVTPLRGSPAAIDLLDFACSTFPQSSRLANVYGTALRWAGDQRASYREFARAVELRRSSQIFQAENPKPDGVFYFGQFAEHIQPLLP